MEADGDGEGVEAALFDAAAVGVVPAALGAPQAIGDPADEGPELGAQHPVERGVGREHPVVALAEVQPPAPTLAQVLLVQIDRILVALGPALDLPPGTVGGNRRHLCQQGGIVVDRPGARRFGGAGQGVGVLGRDVAIGERLGHLRHLGEGAGPPPASPSLAMGAARVASQHLHRVHTTVAQALQSRDGPRLGGVGAGPHPAERSHQRPQHTPPCAVERQGAQLRHERIHQTQHPPRRIGRPHERDLRQRPATLPGIGPAGAGPTAILPGTGPAGTGLAAARRGNHRPTLLVRPGTRSRHVLHGRRRTEGV